jgi:hypothetical protein
MRQELTFLSHLTRLVGGEPEGGYRPPAAMGGHGATGAAPRAAGTHRLLDLEA